MDKLLNALQNPSKAIRHVHCCTIDGSGSQLSIKWNVLGLNDTSKDSMVVVTTCKYANTLHLLLEDLGHGANIRKDNCKNIDSLMQELTKIMKKLHKKRIILGIFCSEDLPNIGASALAALLAIPSSYSHARLLTVSETPWGFTEQIEALGSFQPVELFYKESIRDHSYAMELAEKTGLEKHIVTLVIQSVSMHVEDKHVIYKICKEVYQYCESNEFTTMKEKVDAVTKELPKILNRTEASILLKPTTAAEVEKCAGLNIPILDQLIILASYCATHNSVASDKRFFTKHHGKEKRNERRDLATELAFEQKENGPKAADIQRIYFIFEVLLHQYKDELEKEHNVKISPSLYNILPRFATLCNTAYVSRASSFANLDQPKIRCMISLDIAKKIARNLNIQLENYLEQRV